jgi:hypothetical protein
MTTQILDDPRGLFSPETMAWKIHSDPAMAVGGIRIETGQLTIIVAVLPLTDIPVP